jgi:hypothetical protein
MSQTTKDEVSLAHVSSRKLLSRKATLVVGLVVSTLLAGARIGGCAQPAVKGGAEPVAVVSLFNVTTWKGPLVVEVPTGRIATPGLLDWRRVQLQVGGQTLPFSIREGRAHWQTRARTPITMPHAEDLLVFTCAVPPGEWARVQVLASEASNPAKHLVRARGRYAIAYDSLRAVIDEASGQLRELSFMGEPLLAGPLTTTVNRLSKEAPYGSSGAFGPGYADPADPTPPKITVNRREAVPFRTRCVSTSSTAAMTELNFLLETSTNLSIAVTYRVYANGVVDILADGQPWEGGSPWCAYAASYDLPMAGKATSIPHLEDRFPFYGFKGYAAAVKQAAYVRRGTRAGVIELGEETVNGRRWARRLAPYRLEDDAAVSGLIEALDTGYVVDVLPVRVALPEAPLKVACPASAQTAQDVVAKALQAGRVHAEVASGSGSSAMLKMELVPAPAREGITGDGYQIRSSGRKRRVSVRAGTKLGLYQAATVIAAHLAESKVPSLPLVSRNPVVALRGGGFGGGDFEVDFPYGSEEEWKRTLDCLTMSGMNCFACLGMWGNWKMPVSYAYMPELRSSAPDAFDESSGAKFTEIDQHRQRGLRLTHFLQDRGAKVWLWIPIGCVPTTFAQKFPQAMAPRPGGGRSDKIPCFTHPDYRRYTAVFFRELLETYPIEGLVLIRDDNGGLCTCDRCAAYVAASRTKSAAWEQYLGTYQLLRSTGFKGDIAVYPYFDPYEPRLEPLLPDDLYVVGHGGETAVLARDYDRTGLMGDTWLDNLYANFRLPPSARMRRLLSDRGSFWIGGAYCGTELPWESVGRFGFEPTATPNTLRFEWGTRTFGREHGIAFVRLSQSYEQLWEINARYLLPRTWMRMSAEERTGVLQEGTDTAQALRARLAELKNQTAGAANSRWFAHMELFAPFIEYHMHRLDLFAKISDLVSAHQQALQRGEPLPADVRNSVLAMYKEIYGWAAKYDDVMKRASEGMLARCKWMTSPYKEWMAGYDQWLEPHLKMKQFAGTMRIQAELSAQPATISQPGTPIALQTGRPFTLTITLHNLGVCPWIPNVGHQLQLSGAAAQLGLPSTWEYEGEWMAPGDTQVITLRGTAPATPGTALLKATFLAPFRVPEPFVTCETPFTWN